MLAYTTTESGAIRTIQIDIATNPNDLEKDLREIVAQRIKTMQLEIYVIEANAVIAKKRLDALANTYNNLSYEEKLRAETRITKLSIQIIRLINRISRLSTLKTLIENRLRQYDQSKAINISNFII